MLSPAWYVVQIALNLSLMLGAYVYATHTEPGQQLAEVNQPQLSQKLLKYGTKISTKSKQSNVQLNVQKNATVNDTIPSKQKIESTSPSYNRSGNEGVPLVMTASSSVQYKSRSYNLDELPERQLAAHDTEQSDGLVPTKGKELQNVMIATVSDDREVVMENRGRGSRTFKLSTINASTTKLPFKRHMTRQNSILQQTKNNSQHFMRQSMSSSTPSPLRNKNANLFVIDYSNNNNNNISVNYSHHNAPSFGGTQPRNTKSFAATTVATETNSNAIQRNKNNRSGFSNRAPEKYLTITTTTTTPANVPHVRPQLSMSSAFNLFTPEFWKFFNVPVSPTVSTTKKPPKKYRLPLTNGRDNSHPQIKEEKKDYQKSEVHQVTITVPTTTTTTSTPASAMVKTTDGPFRIAIPTRTHLQSVSGGVKGRRETAAKLRNKFNCPRESEVRFQLFPKICKIDEDCKVWNRDELCCEIFGAKSCVSGLPKPLTETPHAPILGLIPRKCPIRPLAELWWDVTECETDMDCWPRVCCPDGSKRYCRTSQPELNTIPLSVQRSFNYLAEYLECTPPPPPIFDIHPKLCTSTFDCFPNVCCQEAGLRHCRPPKKSLLTMLANVFNVGFVKRLTENIVIK